MEHGTAKNQWKWRGIQSGQLITRNIKGVPGKENSEWKWGIQKHGAGETKEHRQHLFQVSI